MKSIPLAAGLAALMATTCGAPLAMAQPADPNYQAQQQQYQDQQQQYQNAQQDYQNRTADYQAQRDAYRRAHEHFEHERAAYDARYGEGAFVRYYHEHHYEYDAAYWPGAWDRDFGEHPAFAEHPGYAERTDYYSDYRDSPCERRADDHAAAGAVIGAIAGGALGANIGMGPGRAGGLAIGAVLGGVVGANIGHQTARCDARGYYFTYEQTYPYREGEWERGPSGQYDYTYYSHHGCRLAVAPAHWGDHDDWRYVRVCPDDRGNYRITS
jgi:hypothetical protein